MPGRVIYLSYINLLLKFYQLLYRLLDRDSPYAARHGCRKLTSHFYGQDTGLVVRSLYDSRQQSGLGSVAENALALPDLLL